MEFCNVIEGNNLKKKFKGFELNIPKLRIPKGFATALIGENGAGKTTLLNILTGIRLDYQGSLTYFERFHDADREKDPQVKARIGYTGPGNYYLPHWTVKQVEEVSSLLFDSFDRERFHQWCTDLDIFNGAAFVPSKKVSTLSDGTVMKLMFAGVMARQTDLLVMDEPASPLDPLMREKLCQMIRDYLNEKEGEHSVFFSTHNISDMENVTDYAIIMEHGKIVEQGFVEELKEKYILVKGEKKDEAAARQILFSISTNPYGYEGICLADDLDKLAGLDITTETASLFQISVAVMRANTRIKIN